MILNSLFPDTSYENESGGDPEVIPKLMYEQFLEFHSRYYHPSNSYIYLYGDMDMEEKLEWLDREYLSKFDTLQIDSAIKEQAPLDVYKRQGKYASGEQTCFFKGTLDDVMSGDCCYRMRAEPESFGRRS